MKNRYLLACIAIVLAMLAVSLLAYGRLPERVPVHWGPDGEADRYGGRASIFIHNAMMGFFLGLWCVLPRISPRHFEVEDFKQTYWQAGVMVIVLLAYLQGVILWGSANGAGVDMTRALVGAMGVFSVLLGNVIGKVRRNFWLGIRTPWTLASERVWYATHRLAAKSMVIAGLLALACALAGLRPLIGVCLFGAGMLLPAGWSLLYYKRLERSGRLEA